MARPRRPRGRRTLLPLLRSSHPPARRRNQRPEQRRHSDESRRERRRRPVRDGRSPRRFVSSSSKSNRDAAALAPCDADVAGHITRGDLRAALIDPLPRGVRLTVVLDCPEGGAGAVDLPFAFERGTPATISGPGRGGRRDGRRARGGGEDDRGGDAGERNDGGNDGDGAKGRRGYRCSRRLTTKSRRRRRRDGQSRKRRRGRREEEKAGEGEGEKASEGEEEAGEGEGEAPPREDETVGRRAKTLRGGVAPCRDAIGPQ